ncbi:MAG TPA: hypothetical protein VFE19_04505 [Jatrophihabitantaceae bacterium]|jgi:magnesium-transporting ATPase (P-type)|nr:hypothetical protein [Jatrophihabitantaceae bacterium]
MTQPPEEAQYGQPPAEFGAPGTARAHQQPPAKQRRVRGVSGLRFGYIGALVAVVGTVLVVLAFTTLSWLRQHDSTFAKIHERLGGDHLFVNGFTQAYFSWLGWVLVGVVFVVALAANLPYPRIAMLRPIGFLLALVAIGLTFWAIKFTTSTYPTYFDYLRLQRAGFYFAVGGFLITGVGALFGAKRRG